MNDLHCNDTTAGVQERCSVGIFLLFFFTYLYLNHPRHNYRAAAVGSERTIAKGDAFFFQYAIVVVRMTEKMQLKR